MTRIESSRKVDLTDSAPSRYDLCLYIAGSSPRSRQAVTNVRKICANLLSGVCDLEVVDILQQPQAARDNQIIAVPTLIKRMPKPTRLFIGDMSNVDAILRALEG